MSGLEVPSVAMVCASCLREHEAGQACDPHVLARVQDELPTQPPSGMPVDPDQLIGTQLGSFRLVRRLGKGGMGSVYLGEHVSIGSRVAVKVLHSHLAAYPELVQRFYAEARAVNLIGHENIVNVFDLVATPPRPYLIMEYLEGVPLAALVGGPVPSEVWVPLLAQVCEALHAAHQRGIVHRDLKPDNIFLVKRARGPDFVKVLDFGIAKLVYDERGGNPVTSSGVIIGTPEYMAPEQANSNPVDGRADIYALGIIAYQLATGQRPFIAESVGGLLVAHQTQAPPPLRSVYPGASAAIERVILRALAKAPADRYENALALRAALEKALEDEREEAATSPALAALAVSTTGQDAPASEPARQPVALPARVVVRPGAAPERYRCSDLSRGGLFLDTEGPMPPLFTRVAVTLELESGPLTFTGEVVSHVTPEQGRIWRRTPGFGVQFVEATPTLRTTVGQLLRGEAVAPPSPKDAPEDPEAKAVLERYRERLKGDHYAVLALPPDAGFEVIRGRAREVLSELEDARRRPLRRLQRTQLDAAMTRVREAGDTLSNLAKRAAYDAQRGNFRGVGCCLTAGLTATQLEGLRREFLSSRPHAAGTSHVHFLTGKALERDGQLARALESYERGLTVDPLDLNLQQRHRALQRVLATRGKPG